MKAMEVFEDEGYGIFTNSQRRAKNTHPYELKKKKRKMQNILKTFHFGSREFSCLLYPTEL